VLLGGAWLAGCPAPRRPAPPPAASAAELTIEIGRDGGSLRGIAGDAAVTYAAVTTGEAEAEQARAMDPGGRTAALERTEIAARRGAAVAWRIEIDGGGGPLARSGALVVAALAGTGAVAAVPLRGSPGAVAVGLDAATGEVRWKLAIDASEWAVIAAVAPMGGGGVVIGGSFGGTLRAGAAVVSSGGKADGFVARVSAAGELGFLVRMGGPGVDGVRGVAAAGDRIAIAGTFSAGADLRGAALDAFDAGSPAADGFVAELDAATARPRWTAVWGGKLDDGVAGVAIDRRGRVVVAGTARDVVHVGGRDLVAPAAGSALIAWWERGGAAGPAILLGGGGGGGAAAIAAVGDRVVVGAFSGDDARLVALDGGAVVEAWPVGGAGREEIPALAAVPGGFVAGVAHTGDLRVGAAALAAPRDPLAGAALIVRAVR
jgi:hypothetical protein